MAPNFSDQTSQVLVNGFAGIVGFQLIYFIVVRFALEGYVMPCVFRKAYLDLTIINQRSFTAHVLWLTVKVCLIPAAWPFIQVFFCGRTLKDSLFPGTPISNADFLSIAYFAVISMFLFEIIYRLKISPVSLIHHTAGCALGVWQVVEEVYLDDASTESQFRLLILYGVFEVLFETFPHAAVVLYRCQHQPDGAARMTAAGLRRTARVWLMSGCSSLVSMTAELVAMAVFMWRNWALWGLAMRVVLPGLHFAFMAAQVHGARVGFQLFGEFRRRAAEVKAEGAVVGRVVKDGDGRAGSEGGGSVGAGAEGEEEEEQQMKEEKMGAAVQVRVEREAVCEEGARAECCCSCREPVDRLQLPLYPGA